jgi:hypothetical protein
MKRARIAAVLACAAVGIAVRAPAQQFEGVVTIRTVHLSSDIVADQIGEEPDERAREKLFAMSLAQLEQASGAANTNVMQVKGGRMRSAAFEMPGLGSGYMVIDMTSGMMRTVTPSKRAYYEMSLRTPGAAAAEQQEDMKIEPLGRTQVINGLRCTGYRVTQGDQVSRVWTTDDAALRQLMNGFLSMAGQDNDEGVQGIRALVAKYGAAVMTQEFDEEGGYRIEVWSLERKTLPDSLFAIPAGFSKMQMPGQ